MDACLGCCEGDVQPRQTEPILFDSEFYILITTKQFMPIEKQAYNIISIRDYIVKVLVLAQDQDSLLRHPLDRAVPASLLFTSIRLFDSDAEYLPKP